VLLDVLRGRLATEVHVHGDEADGREHESYDNTDADAQTEAVVVTGGRVLRRVGDRWTGIIIRRGVRARTPRARAIARRRPCR